MSFQTTYGPDGRLRVAILGCTGFIGTQALDVCRQHADRLQVTALSVNLSYLRARCRCPRVLGFGVTMADVAHGDDAVLQELPEGTKLALARSRFASSRVATMSTACSSLLWVPPVSRRAMRP